MKCWRATGSNLIPASISDREPSPPGNRKQRLDHLAQVAITLVLALCFAGCQGRMARQEAGENDVTAIGEVRVAAAADLKFALDEIVKQFRQDHPKVQVDVTYGSSGNFYSQLLNQAPFDIYFSADVFYPRKLSEQGLALPNSDFCYAIGRIVIWAPASSKIDVERLGMQALNDPAARRIAIANPKHAPYGKAAEAAMRSANVFERVKDRLVYGENIAQTLQFIQSASADIGIVALSLALAPKVREAGRYWEIPLDAYPRMDQGGIILKWARDPDSARAFRSFVSQPRGHEVLRKYGFFLPGE
ncbi:MAG: molybdate ABC transporter substrate-binding protein [Acidobacteria bacterium]|nr:molybdate ABC transporter substrate-binding protein [Acidobacteriota bacterium]